MKCVGRGGRWGYSVGTEPAEGGGGGLGPVGASKRKSGGEGGEGRPQHIYLKLVSAKRWFC